MMSWIGWIIAFLSLFTNIFDSFLNSGGGEMVEEVLRMTA